MRLFNEVNPLILLQTCCNPASVICLHLFQDIRTNTLFSAINLSMLSSFGFHEAILKSFLRPSSLMFGKKWCNQMIFRRKTLSPNSNPLKTYFEQSISNSCNPFVDLIITPSIFIVSSLAVPSASSDWSNFPQNFKILGSFFFFKFKFKLYSCNVSSFLEV